MAARPDAFSHFRWHLVTPEYPPAIGGVADHTCLLADALASAGDEVHVWAPGHQGLSTTTSGVSVHRDLGRFQRADLARAGDLLSSCPSPRRLFVQWVPHGYGARSMNLSFCRWVLQRARSGDEVDLMVHEPFLAFREGSASQDAAAAVHRVMMVMLLRAARRVWLSTEAWRGPVMFWALGRSLRCQWLPIGSSLRPVPAGTHRVDLRQSWASRSQLVVGHFSTHGRHVVQLLREAMGTVLHKRSDVVLVLIGEGSERTREAWLRAEPALSEQVYATGVQTAEQASHAVSSVDLLCQPYPDGVTCRRTTAMAALALGVPLVTTHGRLSEVWWRDTPAADASSPAGDASSLSATVIRLLDNESERRALAATGAARYRQELSLARAVECLRSAS